MLEKNTTELQTQIEEIVKEYLYNISSLHNHDYFSQHEVQNNHKIHSSRWGFGVLEPNNENSYVVMEEVFLEGCTRVFLINPVFKLLMDTYGIQNDWEYGTTFSNYLITNREYELGSYLEFIANLDGKHIGVRYTRNSYSGHETYALDNVFAYQYKNVAIPGFDNLKTIDEIYVLDWFGFSKEELDSQNTPSLDEINKTKILSVESFFENYFSDISYEYVIKTFSDAIKDAKRIISLHAIPQLLPNNMLNLKAQIRASFSEKYVDTNCYEFRDGGKKRIQDKDDLLLIKKALFEYGYCDAIIGTSDFAKSFITSEYLFMTLKNGLGIDYTAVIVGYLKAIEQLLYMLYLSAFDGKRGMSYWDRCNKTDCFDETKPDQYRIDPYNLDKKWPQEYYYHKKKTGAASPEIGELTRFLRYYSPMWSISESSKELVFEFLEDFRSSCRNSHFHKDNIYNNQYAVVTRVRNNAYICIGYLLGGFKMLDLSRPISNQLGIVDYSFEKLYYSLTQSRSRRRHFAARFHDGDECVLYYLNDDKNVEYNSDGILQNAELRFLKINICKDETYRSEINQLLDDKQFVQDNTISINRLNIPAEMEAFIPKKRRTQI